MEVPDSFTIERDQPAPGVTEVRVLGEVDLGSGRHLERELREAVDAGGGVLVNLAGCTFLDSSGLSALIRVAREAGGAARVAVHCPPEGTVRQVFALTRAHTLLDVHGDRRLALAALQD